jgi:hypothetical protein
MKFEIGVFFSKICPEISSFINPYPANVEYKVSS